jgi:hypothetical protein
MWPARLPTLRRVEPDEVPYRVNAADAVVVPSDREGSGLWSARRMAGRVVEAGTEPIDPALYSRAEAPMGAVRT